MTLLESPLDLGTYASDTSLVYPPTNDTIFQARIHQATLLDGGEQPTDSYAKAGASISIHLPG